MASAIFSSAQDTARRLMSMRHRREAMQGGDNEEYISIPHSIQIQLDKYRGALRNTFIHFPLEPQPERPSSMPGPGLTDSVTRAAHTLLYKNQPVTACHHDAILDRITDSPCRDREARESFALSTASTVESDVKNSGMAHHGLSSTLANPPSTAGDCTPTTTSAASDRSNRGGRNGRRLRRCRQSIEISLENPGSRRHDTADCQPCHFVFTTLGCRHNQNCPFCHHPSHCSREMVDSIFLNGSQALTVSFNRSSSRPSVNRTVT